MPQGMKFYNLEIIYLEKIVVLHQKTKEQTQQGNGPPLYERRTVSAISDLRLGSQQGVRIHILQIQSLGHGSKGALARVGIQAVH